MTRLKERQDLQGNRLYWALLGCSGLSGLNWAVPNCNGHPSLSGQVRRVD